MCVCASVRLCVCERETYRHCEHRFKNAGKCNCVKVQIFVIKKILKYANELNLCSIVRSDTASYTESISFTRDRHSTTCGWQHLRTDPLIHLIRSSGLLWNLPPRRPAGHGAGAEDFALLGPGQRARCAGVWCSELCDPKAHAHSCSTELSGGKNRKSILPWRVCKSEVVKRFEHRPCNETFICSLVCLSVHLLLFFIFSVFLSRNRC